MAKTYREAAAKMQKNVQKCLQDMEELSSSDEEEAIDSTVLNRIFRSYERGGGDNQLVIRTKILLEESISGRPITCLICIGSVKRLDYIWSCVACYSYFHLPCIQKWSNDCISLKDDENVTPISVYVPKKIEWCCPKCRHSYNKDEVPRKYFCFCGKLDNPPFHPWLVPHSCGEVCGKRLSTGDTCSHCCLLLCHPGPCPPCPQTVNSVCFCGSERKKIRCSSSKWSCGERCNRTLECKSHKCESICHEGECPPCKYTSIQSCLCGSEEIQRPCNDLIWQCSKVCNKLFSCEFHRCEQVCHSGECGSCPNSGRRSCPCGATEREVQCPDTMETCVSTCGRKQENCEHHCPVKCHRGPCPPCQVLVEKRCFCSWHVRSLPCSRDFKCDTKCRGIRPCGKHTCGRKCCNGNCAPCDRTCDKPLHCGRHKCTMVCHSGPCYPCPRESKITCRCKETVLVVPCGREKHTKPPKCSLPCKVKYKCGHRAENKHVCHFGECPPCKAICNKPYDKCSHACNAKCHEAVAVVFEQTEKPATPWEVQRPKTKIMKLDCPPCEIPVSIKCFGKHEITKQPCHIANRYSCGKECGQPIACGNHKCTKICHLTEPDDSISQSVVECESCQFECEVPRPEKCVHKCGYGYCHLGPCPPCQVLERRPCHCGVTELYVRCNQLIDLSEEELSCKQQCPKLLLCGHRCRNLCHSQNCGMTQICSKKVKVYCACGNIKKDMPCNVILSGEGLVPCDETCEIKLRERCLEREKEERRRRELEEEKNRRELAEYEWKFGKKKKYKEKKVKVTKNNRNWLQTWGILIITIIVVLLSGTYYISYV